MEGYLMKKKALTLFLLASLSTQFINLKITNAMVNESPLYHF